jgi:ribokinase
VPPPFDVVVVGSANLDVRLQVDRLPRAGETVLATRSDRGPGGKGANQAVAAARSGARTAFLGTLGADEGGALLVAALEDAGVDTGLVRRAARPTGTAYVVVDDAGENLIVVDPGANHDLRDLTDDERSAIAAAPVVLCQLEVPLATVAGAATAVGPHGTFVLNAAPATNVPADLLELVDVLVVNEHEAATLAGHAPVPTMVVTRGDAGVVLARRGQPPVEVPAAPARRVVDTTGAGDTFCGALAAALATGADLELAVRRAVVAGSLSVERPGAAESAPTHDEVTARLDELERDGP